MLYFFSILLNERPRDSSLVQIKACKFEIFYNRTHALAANVYRIRPLSVVGDFLFWLVIFFGLVLSLKLQKWNSLIAKGLICEVSSQSLKRREAAEKIEITIKPHARPDEHFMLHD